MDKRIFFCSQIWSKRWVAMQFVRHRWTSLS
jgi:hypothetical protein